MPMAAQPPKARRRSRRNTGPRTKRCRRATWTRSWQSRPRKAGRWRQRRASGGVSIPPLACNWYGRGRVSGYGDGPLMSGPRRLPRVRLPFGRDPNGEELATPGEDGGVMPSAIGVATASLTPVPTRLSETFRAFRHRNYRLYYSGQAVSLSGTWMQTVAQSWLVLQITDSKEALGVVTMLQFLPITLLVLFAGVIADRVPKRNFIMAMQVLAMSQAVVLTALVWSGQ